jgi:hypothetical protein
LIKRAMETLASSIFDSFLGAAVPPVKFTITDSTLLAQLAFDAKIYVLCAKYLADVLGELFPDVRRVVSRFFPALTSAALTG